MGAIPIRLPWTARSRHTVTMATMRYMARPADTALKSDAVTEPLTRWLIAAAKRWETLTYGEIECRLRTRCNFGRTFPWRMGIAASAAMDKILRVDGSAPILVCLIVRKDDKLPGKGVDEYLCRRFPDDWPGGRRNDEPRAYPRKRVVERAMEEVYACDRWSDLYLRLYGGENGGKSAASAGGRAYRPLVPNEETIAAIEAARRGELVTVDGAEALMADADADD